MKLLILYRESQQDTQAMLRENNAVLQHVKERIKSLRAANPQVSKRVSASIFDQNALQELATGFPNEEDEFDNDLANSRPYRRVNGATRKTPPQVNTVIEDSDTDSDGVSFKSALQEPVATLIQDGIITSRLESTMKSSTQLNRQTTVHDLDTSRMRTLLSSLEDTGPSVTPSESKKATAATHPGSLGPIRSEVQSSLQNSPIQSFSQISQEVSHSFPSASFSFGTILRKSRDDLSMLEKLKKTDDCFREPLDGKYYYEEAIWSVKKVCIPSKY